MVLLGAFFSPVIRGLIEITFYILQLISIKMLNGLVFKNMDGEIWFSSRE